MNFKTVIRFIVWTMLTYVCVTQPMAQTQFEHPYHDYKATYNADGEYSIIYDNITEFSKLKEFRLKFYDSNGLLLVETATEIYPVAGTAKTYSLSAPVTGFDVVELSIISLYHGYKADFPTDIKNILGIPLVPDKDIPVGTQSLTDTEKARLGTATAKIDSILRKLNTKTLPFKAIAEDRSDNLERISEVLSKTETLLEKAQNKDPQNLTPQINDLNETLLAAKNDIENDTDLTEKQTLLDALKAKLTDLRQQIAELLNLSEIEGADIPGIMSLIPGIESQTNQIESQISAIDLPEHVTIAEIETLEAAYTALNNQYNSPPDPPSLTWSTLLGFVLIVLTLLGLAAKFLLSAKTKPRLLKSAFNHSTDTGVIFPASPMLAGNVAAPLAPAGQLAAAQLQMLSGPYAVLKPAYQATGRIGYAQDGVPSAEDYAFGTGFLVSDRHVVTNRHVHGLYGHYLLDEKDPGGIEFIAEKGKDASDFAPFNGEPPLLLPALDIAIFTLERPVTNRAPVQLTPIETNLLHTRDIVVIGYPDTHTPNRPDILAVVEDDPIFAVKRLSQGQIFRHSTDIDTPFGVETSVSESETSNFSMPAVCHNASTMSGNSGSPLLDIKTGQLLGVHFAGFKVFNSEEAANLAMAIAQLTQNTELKSIPGVTAITETTAKQS